MKAVSGCQTLLCYDFTHTPHLPTLFDCLKFLKLVYIFSSLWYVTADITDVIPSLRTAVLQDWLSRISPASLQIIVLVNLGMLVGFPFFLPLHIHFKKIICKFLNAFSKEQLCKQYCKSHNVLELFGMCPVGKVCWESNKTFFLFLPLSHT